MSSVTHQSLHLTAVAANIIESYRIESTTPIYKKGSKNDAGNYRPVSLTSVPCKVLKSIMKDAMMDYL